MPSDYAIANYEKLITWFTRCPSRYYVVRNNSDSFPKMHLDPTCLRIFSAYFNILSLNSENWTSRLMSSLKQFWGRVEQYPCIVASLMYFKTLLQSSVNLLHWPQGYSYRNKTYAICDKTMFLSKVTAMHEDNTFYQRISNYFTEN